MKSQSPIQNPQSKIGIVCLAGEDWWYHPMRSRRQLMTRLSRDRRVLFVNSIGSGLPSTKSKSGFCERLLRKARSWSRGLRQAQSNLPNLFVLSPIALPGAGQGLLRTANNRFLVWQIKRAMGKCEIDRPILWVGLPSFAPIIGRLGERLTIFHASDRFDAYTGIEADRIQDALHACIKKANLAIAVSEPLVDMVRQVNPSIPIHLITHGVDIDLFSKARQPNYPEHPQLSSIPKPRLGYIGSIEKFQDEELLQKIARKHPDWHLVFVGPHSDDLSGLVSFSNVHFLPQCPAEEVPAYLAGFDLCMIPRRLDSWVTHSNPLKFKEYLAAGREVVASDIPALRPWARYAWLCATHESFITACETILLRGESRIHLLEMPLLAAESWDIKANEVERLLNVHTVDFVHTVHHPESGHHTEE